MVSETGTRKWYSIRNWYQFSGSKITEMPEINMADEITEKIVRHDRCCLSYCILLQLRTDDEITDDALPSDDPTRLPNFSTGT